MWLVMAEKLQTVLSVHQKGAGNGNYITSCKHIVYSVKKVKICKCQGLQRYPRRNIKWEKQAPELCK